MKKFHIALMGVAALALASCSSDEPTLAGSDGATTFTINLPASVQSRAFGDGAAIADSVKLYYSVFEQTSDPAQLGTYVVDDSLAAGSFTPNTGENTYSTSITLILAKGKKYNVVFWAENDPENAYTWAPQTATMTVNYGKMASNRDNLDAYFGKAVVNGGDKTASALLQRPFAQLNVGTSDLSTAPVKVTYGNQGANLKTKLTIPAGKLNTKLNLFTGITSDTTTTDVAFAAVPKSGQDFTIDGNSYAWLTMDYLLANDSQSLIPCTWEFDNAAGKVSELTVDFTPIRRNYQTNVYGDLLTGSTNMMLKIQPAFFYPANPVMVGRTWADYMEIIPASQINETAKTITVNTPGELAYIAAISNGTVTRGNIPVTFADYTINLGNDIDLSGHEWVPIANGAFDETKAFHGTIQGANHTISGMTIAGVYNPTTNDYLSAGLIANISKATINEVKIADAYVDVKSYPIQLSNPVNGVGILTGYYSRDYNAPTSGPVTISNCEISNSFVQSSGYVGGIMGFGKGIVGINNCTVTGTTLINYPELISGIWKRAAAVGGLLGFVMDTNSTNKITTNTVDNCTVKGAYAVGGAIGINDTYVTKLTVTNSQIVRLSLPDGSKISFTIGVYPHPTYANCFHEVNGYDVPGDSQSTNEVKSGNTVSQQPFLSL